MTEKRMAGEYEIVQAISVGSEEIVLGYAPHNESLPYMTAFCTQNELFTAYQHCIADDSYPHILGIFSERMTDAVKELERQLSAENAAAVDNRPYNQQKCLSTDQCSLVSHADDLHQKVVIIKPDVLKPEYQLATRQLYLCPEDLVLPRTAEDLPASAPVYFPGSIAVLNGATFLPRLKLMQYPSGHKRSSARHFNPSKRRKR